MPDPRILLAHSPQRAIFACKCGAIHITAGELAFSVSLEEFIVMLELRHQAIDTLEQNLVAVRELCQRPNLPRRQPGDSIAPRHHGKDPHSVFSATPCNRARFCA
jgi:hypothetical protein